MFRPQFEVALGSLILNNEKNENIDSILIEQSTEIPSDNLIVLLANDEKHPTFSIKKGDKASASLGYHNEEMEQLFTGTIDSVESDINTTRISCMTSMINLCRLRTDLFFEQQTSGFIVKELLKLAQVEADEGGPSDGILFPFYAIDSNTNAFEHVKKLSRLNGFVTYMNNMDKFVFKKFDPKKTHTIEYGKDIIHVTRIKQTLESKSVEVYGESPSSSMGSDTAHWLTKKQVKGESPISAEDGNGEAGRALLVYERVLKDDEMASHVAKAAANRLNLSEMVGIRIAGNQKIMLGHAVELKNIPDDSLNGKYQIRDISHALNKGSGFITLLKCIGPL